MNRCKVCRLAVLDSRNRRSLESSQSKQFRDGIIALCIQNEIADVGREFSSGYVCKRCFDAVMKYLNLKRQYKSLEEDLINKLSSSLESLQSQSTSLTSASTTERRGVKRPTAAPGSTEKPAVKVIVTYSEYEKRYVLTPSRSELGRSLGRNSRRKFAEHVLDNSSTRKQIMLQFSRIIEGQMKKLCHEEKLLGDGLEVSEMLSNCNYWSELCQALEKTAPVLVSFLKVCIPKSQRNLAVLVACIGLLVNSHRKPTIVQKLVSIFLYSGHAGKQVYTRLQKFGMCLCSESTRALIHKLGIDHDSSVLAWVEDLKKTISTNHGTVVSYINGTLAGSLDAADSTPKSPNLSWLYDPAMSPLQPVFASTPEHSNASLNNEELGSMSPCAPDFSFFSEECDDSPSTHHKDTSASVSQSSVLQSTPPASVSQSTPPGSVSQSTPPSVSQSTPPSVSQSTPPSVSQSTPAPTISVPTQSLEDSHQLPNEWSGFRLVGDNIDKTVKPRDMRLSHQSSSLHYFHVYAVKDRIDFGKLNCDATLIDPTTIDTTPFLPTQEDAGVLIANFEELIARILSHDILKDNDLILLTKHHIEHRYSDHMSKKSQVVPLGVFLKDENKLDEMADILDELHKYVPVIRTTETFQTAKEVGISLQWLELEDARE